MRNINYKSLIINTLIFLTLILNNTNISQITLFILFTLCVLFTSKYSFSISKIFFITIFSITLIINSNDIELKDLIRFFQLFIAFSLFPLKIDPTVINTKMVGSVIIFIFIMAVGSILGLEFESKIKEMYYPIINNPWESNYSEIDSLSSIFQTRYATFFYNSNLLGQTTLLTLIIYFIPIQNLEKNWFDYLILFLGTFLLIICGGRTSFGIFLISIISPILWNMKSKIKYVFIFLGLLIITYIYYNTRLLQIVGNDKSMDSVGIKMNILYLYINNLPTDLMSIITILFGTMKMDILFDSDIGYMIYYSGILSLIYFNYFFIREFLMSRIEFKPYYAFVLIIISATIIFNFKFLILSIIIFSLLQNKIGNRSIRIDKDLLS